MKNKWEHISGEWRQFSGEAKKRWGQLTDDELAQIDGNRKALASLLQKRYSIAKKEADKQIDAWAANLKV
ncbi:MAG: CsbD family protein [Anaerolineae bacterium]|nr:CsbD family protein [Anaerolineae bacterium]